MKLFNRIKITRDDVELFTTKRSGWFCVSWDTRRNCYSMHFAVRRKCWQWGFDSEWSQIGHLYSFGIGPVFLLTWFWNSDNYFNEE